MSSTARKATPRPTPVAEWKTPEAPIELPSGKFMLVKKSSFRVFIASGVIPNSLMSTVQKSLNTGSEPDLSDFDNDPKKLNEAMAMVDNAVIFVAVQPRVYDIPKKVRDEDTGDMVDPPRESDRLYIDEIDEDDKSYIFQYVTGGVKDLEQFRQESAEQLATVQPGKALVSSTE